MLAYATDKVSVSDNVRIEMSVSLQIQFIIPPLIHPALSKIYFARTRGNLKLAALEVSYSLERVLTSEVRRRMNEL